MHTWMFPQNLKNGQSYPFTVNFLFDYNTKAAKVLAIFQIEKWNYPSF